MTHPTILESQMDRSVNMVLDNGQECRYVRRTDEYFIVYLSSHNGCNKACRFCHLTQTKQTKMDPATAEDMIEQAKLVINHYIRQVENGLEKPAQRIHFNWMARGEPLSNPSLTIYWPMIVGGLLRLADEVGIASKDVSFNISTIMPKDMRPLNHFTGVQPRIYYSMYSVDLLFRKRWLPHAREPYYAMSDLKTWQETKHGEVVFHWALIEGENDSTLQVDEAAAAIARSGIEARFNLVRYNPYSEIQGKEPDEEVLKARFERLRSVMKVPGSRIVPRVGFDVKASCGMFVAASTIPKTTVFRVN